MLLELGTAAVSLHRSALVGVHAGDVHLEEWTTEFTKGSTEKVSRKKNNT